MKDTSAFSNKIPLDRHGSTFRELRERLGITQIELSQLLDVTNSSVCRWEARGDDHRSAPESVWLILEYLVMEQEYKAVPTLREFLRQQKERR